MIVRAKKTLKHKELHKKSEVFRVTELHGKQLKKAGLVEEVSQKPEDRTKKVTYKEAGPYVQKFVGGEKVGSLYKSEAKEKWGYGDS